MNKYSQMQKDFYDMEAKKWSLEHINHVVGSFNDHNKWEDYKYLFDGLDTKDMVALDFGCGPGRAIVLYHDKFKRIDGADISQDNLVKAGWYYTNSKLPGIPNFYVTDGTSLNSVPSGLYDLVYSTITLQHICVYEIRLSILKDIYRVLKPDGWFTAQMGYGKHHSSVGYYENNYDAEGTNGRMDTRIERIEEVEKDLKDIGFRNTRYVISEVGPGDAHEKWIYIRGQK